MIQSFLFVQYYIWFGLVCLMATISSPKRNNTKYHCRSDEGIHIWLAAIQFVGC